MTQSPPFDETFPVYIGYDQHENDAFEVCQHSLIRHSSWPLHVVKMENRILQYIEMIDRKFDTRADGVRVDKIDGKPFSTDFSFTRFLVPAMAQYRGWALFCDCDMLFRTDLRELIEMCDDKYAVMVVKHDHRPSETEKMDGQVQDHYFRKNWSSFVLWNCAHPSNMFLTVKAVNSEDGAWLHAFRWLEDSEIGELPKEWNWLEGWSDFQEPAKNVHFTRGGPWLDDYRFVNYSDEWRREKALIENRSETTVRRNALAYTGGR